MLTKNDVKEAAIRIGFLDIGFTTAEPFDTQKEILTQRSEHYDWLIDKGLDLFTGTDPESRLENAKSVIVVLEGYFNAAFPRFLEGYYGRCYLDDDRVTRDGLAEKVKAFRALLREHGISTKLPPDLPCRLAAARAGLGTFGKNCFFYANRAARQSSWVYPIPILTDYEFAPDEPTVRVGCPSWCRNACIAACPTGALSANRKIEPKKCISYLTYHGDTITPAEFREPMGMWIYGCDRCQNVCPRNAPWLSQNLPLNQKVAERAANFDLRVVLHMDEEHFSGKIWPHMFYMLADDIWHWKMNAARVMGNSLDPAYLGDLKKAFHENTDERVKGMTAWAVGRIGGEQAGRILNEMHEHSTGMVREEVTAAQDASRGRFC